MLVLIEKPEEGPGDQALSPRCGVTGEAAGVGTWSHATQVWGTSCSGGT